MFYTHLYRVFLLSLVTAVCFLLQATLVLAQAEEYQPLTGIPGVDPSDITLVGYINALFLLSIALGGVLAVIKITIAGFKYMMSDVVTSKQDARSDITGALLGLAILLATVVVLYTINPQLTSLNVFSGAEKVTLRSAPPAIEDCVIDPEKEGCAATMFADICTGTGGGTAKMTLVDGYKKWTCVLEPRTGKAWEETDYGITSSAEIRLCGTDIKTDTCEILFVGEGVDSSLPIPGRTGPSGAHFAEQAAYCSELGGEMHGEIYTDRETGLEYNICIKK